MRLADNLLCGGNTLDAVTGIDGGALAGLRRDGLLRASVDDPFKIGPEFAHDEVRRYAIARLLVAEGAPAEKILQAGAPRWSLGACSTRVPGAVGGAWHSRVSGAGQVHGVAGVV